MSQVTEQPITTTPTPQAPAAQPAPVEQPQNDIYADGFTEDMLSQMLDADKTAEDEPDTSDAPQDAAETTDPQEEVKPEETAQDEAKAEEPQADEQPDTYEIPLFGQPAKLTADQLIQAAETGIQFMQNRPQVEKAMQLFQAVQGDQQLQAVLQAYSQGQPLPQMAGLNASGQGQPPQPSTPQEAMALLQQQVLAQSLPSLLPQIMKAVEEKYKPFVDDVNNFATEARREKAFAKYQSDPDYSDVSSLMTQNLQAKVAEGAITMQQAAEIDAKLRADPELFGQWFGKFKTALQRSKQPPAAAPAQAVKTVPHAPKLEGSATAVAASAERAQQAMAKALSGDAEAFNDLFENQ